MKKIFSIILIALTVVSCKDFLNEDVSSLITSDSNVMQTEQGLMAALAGAYKPMSYTWHYGYGNTSTQGVLMGSDDMTTHKASNKADFREFDQFNVTNINYRLAFIWDGAYKSIQGANLIIDNYSKVTSGNLTNIRQIAGEAYFLRAFNYFWIARLWEKAPLMLHTENFTTDLLTVQPVSTQELYDQIIMDLDSAKTMMANTRIQPGRASKASAIAVEAQAYLQMAGYPLKQTDKYAKAAALAKELIDNKSTYGLKLLDNYADIWDAANDGNSEEVFALTFLGTSENWNGDAIYGSSARPGDIGGWDDFFSEIKFFNNFPDQPRKTATYCTSVTTKVKGKTVVIPWQDFATGHPYFQKFFGASNTWTLAKSLALIRFSEVYLIYAEAQVMATGDTQDPSALEALNTVVRRAWGVPLYSPSDYDYTSATQAQIVQEKGWEFAGEWERWFDLTRLQMVEQVTAEKDPIDLQPLGAIKYWLPVPGTETVVNPNLN